MIEGMEMKIPWGRDLNVEKRLSLQLRLNGGGCCGQSHYTLIARCTVGESHPVNFFFVIEFFLLKDTLIHIKRTGNN